MSDVLKAFVVNLGRAVADMALRSGVIEVSMPPNVKDLILKEHTDWNITINVASMIKQNDEMRNKAEESAPTSITAMCPHCESMVSMRRVDMKNLKDKLCEELGITDEATIEKIRSCSLVFDMSDKEH